jgi:hypothetical protein
LDFDIAVTIPFGIAGFCSGGALGVWPAGATGNTAAEDFLCGPPGTTPGSVGFPDFGFPVNNNHTGLFLDQGVAFENPFEDLDEVHNASASLVTTDRFAVANFGAIVVGSMFDFEFCGTPTDEDTLVTIGTITEYNSGDTGNVAPTPNFPVFELTFPTTPPAAPGLKPFISNATIGGCDTALLGPIGVAYDSGNRLWVVNELGKYVTEYAEDAFGDAAPINVVGFGTLVDPAYIAVGIDPFGSGHQVIYVSDVGDNSIKVFDVNTPFVDNFLGSIKGGHTKLSRPEGIALLGDDLYVVNNNTNSLLMFDDLVDTGLGNISPKTMVKSSSSKMNFPVGVAGPQFF